MTVSKAPGCRDPACNDLAKLFKGLAFLVGEGSEDEQEGFTKTVIPTETGHIPLLFSFHLFNVARQTGGRRRTFYFTVCPHSKPARRSGIKSSHSVWSEREKERRSCDNVRR